MMIDPTEPKTATAQTTTSSGGDPMSSIEAEIANLAARASDLQRTIGTWNDWYTAALALTLLAAFAVLITNRGVIDRQARLTATQDALLQAKDRQLTERGRALTNELKAKDIKIGEAAGIAATANERAAKLELDAATQRQRAAIAERSLLELQQKLAPREFTAVERKTLIEFLHSAPKGEIDISQTGDPEASRFAETIAQLLVDAGWTLNSQVGMWVGTPTVAGVVIIVRDTNHAPARAKSLQDAFKLIGLNAVGLSASGRAEDTVTLIVGPKYAP